MLSLIEKMNNSIKVAYLYLIIGFCVVVWGLTLTLETSELISSGISADGKVTELIASDDSFYPHITFQDRQGNAKSFTSKVGCSPSCYTVNENVKVLYQSENSSKARVNSLFGLWMPSFISGLVGFSFVGFSTFQIFRLKRQSHLN